MSFIFYIEDMEYIESKGCLDNSYLKTLDEDERELLMKMVLLKLKDITLPG